jgi:hypothetical protein
MSSSRWKLWLGCTAAVAGLWAFAVAQPVLDLLRGAPEFFVAHHADRLDMLAFVALSVLVPPLAAGAVIGVAALIGRRSTNTVAGVVVGALVAVLVLQVSYRLGASSWMAAAWIAVASIALGCAAWWMLRGFRVAVTFMGIAALAVPIVFLSSTGMRAVMRGSTVRTTARTSSQLAPVVLIVFDELPLVTFLDEHGGLDAKRYPNIAALAADGVWFRNATTVSDYTRWALPAILSGRFPKGLSVPTPGDHPDTLFTLLASSHHMKVEEPLTALCPAPLSGKILDPFWERQTRVFADVRIVASHVLLPPDARTGLPDITQGWAGFDAKEAEFRRVWKQGEGVDHRSTAMAFVDGITSADSQPTLYFMHTLVSHHPPRWLASGQNIADFTAPPGILPGLVWTTTEWPVIQYQQGHLVQAGLADLLIGRLQTRLREARLYDRAMIVITADHGLSFRPGDEMRDFTPTNGGEILPVPLIVKMPANRQILPSGTVDDRNVETIDIMPTIADGLGINLPWSVDGTSALRQGPPRTEKRIYFNKNAGLKQFTTEEVVRLRTAAEQRKLALFGTGTWPSPSPPGLESLLGRSVESLEPENPTGTLRLSIDNMFALDDVKLGESSLPVLVKGRVLAPAGQYVSSVHMAVALNGEIVATTRTWSDKADWRALLPPDRLRNGRNDLEVFIVDPARPQRLVRTVVRRQLPPNADLLFGDNSEFGVTHEGFHHIEKAGNTPFHRTDGASLIRVPLGLGRKPKTLSVGVLQSAKENMPLRILIDNCEVATITMPGGTWSKDLAIGNCVPSGRWMTIRFLSETVRPGDQDRRRLGVALTQVTLR